MRTCKCMNIIVSGFGTWLNGGWDGVHRGRVECEYLISMRRNWRLTSSGRFALWFLRRWFHVITLFRYFDSESFTSSPLSHEKNGISAINSNEFSVCSCTCHSVHLFHTISTILHVRRLSADLEHRFLYGVCAVLWWPPSPISWPSRHSIKTIKRKILSKDKVKSRLHNSLNIIQIPRLISVWWCGIYGAYRRPTVSVPTDEAWNKKKMESIFDLFRLLSLVPFLLVRVAELLRSTDSIWFILDLWSWPNAIREMVLNQFEQREE